jgi:hypothetical protein
VNAKKTADLSARAGFVAVLALVYWVIIFTTTSVFGLKLFKEQAAELFMYSIIGILTVMFGALIINIMANLTRIAEKINNSGDTAPAKKTGMLVFALSIPLAVLLLFLGNYWSTKKIERGLKQSAEDIITARRLELDTLGAYALTPEWLAGAANTLDFLVRLDPNISDANVIREDSINGSPFFLTFTRYDKPSTDKAFEITKTRYIREYTMQERQYLENVFHKGHREPYFVQKSAAYDLFIPYKSDGGTMVIFFSNRQRYGSLSK